MSRFLVWSIVGIGVLLSGSAAIAVARQWTSRDGKYTVEAELVDVRDGSAVLRKTDGTEVLVPLSKLSLADVQYVGKALEEAERAVLNRDTPPAEEAKDASEDSPAPARSAVAVGKTARTAAKGRAGGPPLTRPNQAGWHVVVERAPELRLPTKPLEFPLGQSFSAKVLFPATPSTCFGIYRHGGKVQCTTWDLRTGGQIGAAAPSSGYVQFQAISPDGLHLAVMPTGGNGKLQVWELRKGTLKREIDLNAQFASLTYLAFAAPTRLLVGVMQQREIQVFDIEDGEKLCSVSLDVSTQQKQLALSHGGTYVAIPHGSEGAVRFYDLRNGALAGTLTVPAAVENVTGMNGTCFSHDGTEFAALATALQAHAIVCWSVADGKPKQTIRLEQDSSLAISGAAYDGSPLEFIPDQKGWLLYGRGVVDRKLERLVWTEEGRDFTLGQIPRRMLPNGRMVRPTGSGSTAALTVTDLPWDQIKRDAEVVAKGGRPGEAELPPLTPADWRGVRQVAHTVPETWRGTASQETATGRGFAAKPIKLSHPGYAVQAIHFAGGESTRAMLAASVTPKAGGPAFDGQPRQQATVLDLSTGSELAKVVPDFPVQWLDLSPAGERLLSRTGKDRDRLDVWDARTGKHVLGFRPYEDAQFKVKMVIWAALLDDSSLLTLGATGKVVKWTLPECKAVYAFETPLLHAASYLLPPIGVNSARDRCAVAHAGQVRLIDVTNGACLGQFATPRQYAEASSCLKLAFSPAGRHLAMAWTGDEVERLSVWDVAAGKLQGDSVLEVGGTELHWADEVHLLVHGFRRKEDRPALGPADIQMHVADLFDLSRGYVTWRYSIPMGNVGGWGPGHRVWYVTGESWLGNGVLYPTQLPTAETAKTLDKIPPPRSLLERGSELSVHVACGLRDVSLTGDTLAKEVGEEVARRLAASGMRVVERAPFALRVRLEEGFNGDYFGTYRIGELVFRGGIPDMSIRCDLEITDAAGQVYWQCKKTFPPRPQPALSRVQDRNALIQSARREQWKTAVAWLGGEAIPDEIEDPRDRQLVGESTLGPTGETNTTIHRTPPKPVPRSEPVRGVRDT